MFATFDTIELRGPDDEDEVEEKGGVDVNALGIAFNKDVAES